MSDSIHPGISGLHAPPYGDRADYLFCFQHVGKSWIAATDGRMLLAVPGYAEFLPPEGGRCTAKSIVSLMETPAIEGCVPAETSAQRLRDFAGPVTQPAVEPCSSCGGDGRCGCPRCDMEHDCRRCEGSGKQERLEIRTDNILGQLVDLNRLARLLSAVDGSCVLTLHANLEKKFTMLRIGGLVAEWEAWLMPIGREEKDAPEFKP